MPRLGRIRDRDTSVAVPGASERETCDMVTLRPATPGDVDAIAEIHIAARRAAMPWVRNGFPTGKSSADGATGATLGLAILLVNYCELGWS